MKYSIKGEGMKSDEELRAKQWIKVTGWLVINPVDEILWQTFAKTRKQSIENLNDPDWGLLESRGFTCVKKNCQKYLPTGGMVETIE